MSEEDFKITRASLQEVSLLFRRIEVNGVKKSTRLRFDISPLFFHTVSKLDQALVIKYGGIFQALAVEGDVLLPRQFLDLAHHRYSPDSAPYDFHVLAN
jgi:hypothetical protein